MSTIDARSARQLIINGKRFTARIFQYHDRVIELYPVQALYLSLDKTHKTIFQWEKGGFFPKPLFQIQGQGTGNCRRWYSREQLLNIARVYTEYPLRKGTPYLKKPFFSAIRKVFYLTRELAVPELQQLIKAEVVNAIPKEGAHGRKEAGQR